MDTKKLRQKVLDLAIRGKLVPQDPNDEPASVLLERIREEKKQMVKEGKLKAKDIKNDTIIFKGDDNLHYEKFQDGTVDKLEDIPFEIPTNWCWTRFGTITINRDSERKPVSASNRTDVEKIYDYYGASGKIDKIDNYLFDERLLLIGEDGANLVTRSKPIAFFAEGKYWVNNHAHCIDATDKSLLDFLCIYINAINLEKYVTGSAQPKMNQDNMNSILVPIPPMGEQGRIISYIDTVLTNIDSLDEDKGEISFLINSAKTKILDLAIRGKLVPQNDNDEPASVLLQRIHEEKESLIKQGKLKRDKKESIIYRGDDNSYYEKLADGSIINIDDELPFEIPPTWCWSRLSSLCRKEIKRGKAPKYIDKSGTLVFAQKCNLKKGGIDYTLAQYLDESTLQKYDDTEFIRTGDIVINSTGTGTLGRVGYIDSMAELPIVPDSHVTTIRVNKEMDSYYIFALMKYLQPFFEKNGEGSTNQKELKPNTLQDVLVPVPPYNEQYMICKAIHNSYSHIKSIEDSII